ncbi:MAG: nuclear transport factor 2 family protein [Rhizomicrobium sp.]
MKTIFTALAASLALTGAATAKDMTATEKQITALEAAVSKAFVDKDVKTLDAALANDWTGQNDAPKIMTKADLIKAIKSGDITAASMTNSPLVIRVVGTIAIVQGGDTEKSTFKGKDTSGVYSWTDILENRGGKWVSIATQVTKVAK